MTGNLGILMTGHVSKIVLVPYTEFIKQGGRDGIQVRVYALTAVFVFSLPDMTSIAEFPAKK